MGYRTKRPRVRKLLVFGAGATLAIAQLGAGCVPLDGTYTPCADAAAVDEAGNCADPNAGDDGGEDGGDGGDAT